jgi:murein DD-endopeptidase MepM/ murein hydrolase activator NlpD
LDISHYLTESCFIESLLKKNALKDKEFKEWVFYPGMLFGSLDKWWDRGKRDKPHEGLDLCFYRDYTDKILRINDGINIPAIFDGIVTGIIDDFLGKSIIIKHNITGDSKSEFYSVYGHVIPGESINIGCIVKQGDIIAALADAGKSKAKIFPHLHITLGYTSEATFHDKLNWTIISDPKYFTLIDPIKIIESDYRVMDRL